MYATSKLERQGRAIAALRSFNRTVWISGRRGWEQKTTKRFNDEEIRFVMGISLNQFNEALNAWEKVRRGINWTIPEMRAKVLAFAHREKRWPTSADLREWRKNDLVARQTMANHEENLDTLIHSLVETRFPRIGRQLILTIPNMTTRRLAWEKYGIEKLIGAGELFQQDDYGKLWRLPTDNSTDPHAQYLEVVNSTPEEDGTFAHYFLRVPPGVVTAQEAAAWTFEREELEIKQAT